MTPNAWAMFGLVLGFALLVAFNTTLALSSSPDVPEVSYPLLIPGDGEEALRTLFFASFVFQAGALFAFAAQADNSGWFILTFAGVFALDLGADVFREPVRAAGFVLVTLLVDWLRVRATSVSKWWIWVRLGIALPLLGSALAIAALT